MKKYYLQNSTPTDKSNPTEKHHKALLSYPKVVLNNEGGAEFDFSGTDYGYFHYPNEEDQEEKFRCIDVL